MKKAKNIQEVFQALNEGKTVTPVGGSGFGFVKEAGLICLDSSYQNSPSPCGIKDLIRHANHGFSQPDEHWRGMWIHD